MITFYRETKQPTRILQQQLYYMMTVGCEEMCLSKCKPLITLAIEISVKDGVMPFSTTIHSNLRFSSIMLYILSNYNRDIYQKKKQTEEVNTTTNMSNHK